MKTIQLFFASCLLLFSISCEPPVAFSEPQPQGSDNLTRFPKRLQGRYLHPIDNSVLVVSANMITRCYDYDLSMHIHELDSNLRLIGDTILNPETNEKTPIKRVGDTLIEHIQYIDTVFRMSYDDVARKFKGHYFLNIRCGPERWMVKKLSLSNGKLTLGMITSKQEIQTLQTLTESTRDTIAPYTFKVSRKQFREFVKHDGFAEQEVFLLVKKP